MAAPPPRVAAAHLDIEDGLQQIRAELLANDRHFDPSRGSCTTCAGAVVDRLSQRLSGRLCQGPRRRPLGADLGDDRAGTPRGSIERSEARQRAAEAVERAVEHLDDRRHLVITST
jgi:hypothetical protein